MKIKKWKEIKSKEKGIILFTILSILLIIGVFFYQSFAVFQVNKNQNLIEGKVEDVGDLEFAFYVDDKLVKDINDIPKKGSEYSIDTSSSYCMDVLNQQQVSTVSWDNERWGPYINNIAATKTKCFLHFKKIYKEGILNGAIPDLMNGRLIPVKISDSVGPSDIDGATGGKVTKADITDEWYSYAKKEWANAVILKNKKDYIVGEEIPEENIESYFVWIPRYEYRLWNGEEETNKFNFTTLTHLDVTDATKQNEINMQQLINIKFVSKNEPIVTGSTKNSWLTHPAFEVFDSNGFWVGKFETGYNQNEDVKSLKTNDWTKVKAEENVNKIASDRVVIKPNVYSWRGINVSNAFYTSYEYKRELESHMMKNMEWGAVAYLTNSIYGRCDNNSCTEVRINNNSDCITGSSSVNKPTCGLTSTNTECNQHGKDKNAVNHYYILDSQESSTTKNYYGVYDISGGVDEYVMGVMQAKEDNNKPASGRNATNNSGFKGPYSCPTCDEQNDPENKDGLEWPSRKYYDLYDYGTRTNYTRGHFGDATKEIGPMYSVKFASNIRYVGSWYADVANFSDKDFPWIIRGGKYSDGTDSGIFKYDFSSGNASLNVGFRIVLSP